MIEVRRAADRFRTVAAGRDTRHSLSFGPHYDPGNLRFGLLVCHNDDLVQPGHGYPDHPHTDLEVVTWVLSGVLHHADSHGHSGDVTPGLVQTMSAGSGVVHAETVDPASGPTRFIQTWVLPDEPGTTPSYSSGRITPTDVWTPIASGSHPDAAARIGAERATFWAATVHAGGAITIPEAPHAHLFIADGSVDLTPAKGGTTHLGVSDAVRLRDEGVVLTVPPSTEGAGAAQLLLWTFA